MKTYFKLCLLSPLWFPALLFLFALINHAFFGGQDIRLPGWLTMTLFFVAFSIIYGGVQYLLTLLMVWSRIDFDNALSWVKVCLLLPLLFTIIQLGSMLVLFPHLMADGTFSAGLGMFAGLDLAIGYGYVLVWFTGFGIIHLIKQLGGGL